LLNSNPLKWRVEKGRVGMEAEVVEGADEGLKHAKGFG